MEAMRYAGLGLLVTLVLALIFVILARACVEQGLVTSVLAEESLCLNIQKNTSTTETAQFESEQSQLRKRKWGKEIWRREMRDGCKSSFFKRIQNKVETEE